MNPAWLIINVLLLTSLTVFCSENKASTGGLLLVANKGDHTLGIIDLELGKQIAAVPQGGITGHEVAASPDGKRAFVPIFGNSGVGAPGTDGRIIQVIDLEAKKVVDTIDFGKGVRPHEAVFGPKDGLLYVTAELDNSLAIIDPANLTIIGRVPTGRSESHMLAISSDGKRGYTSNVGSGSVSVLDLENRKLLTIIEVADKAQRISISADDRWVFTSDQRSPRVAVIDTVKNEVAQWIALPSIGYGTAATPDGKWLVAALPGASKVAIVDLRTMEVVKTIDVPRAPQEVLIHPGGAVAYVSCDRSGKIAEIDLQKWTVSRLIDAGPGADGLAWAPGHARDASDR